MARCARGGGLNRTGLTLTVSADTAADVAVVRLYGELDVGTAGDLRGTLLGLARDHDVVVADFAGVRFCDAAGLGALVAAHNRLTARGGALRLARVRAPQRRILRLARLDEVFRPYADVAAATGRTGDPAG